MSPSPNMMVPLHKGEIWTRTCTGMCAWCLELCCHKSRHYWKLGEAWVRGNTALPTPWFQILAPEPGDNVFLLFQGGSSPSFPFLFYHTPCPEGTFWRHNVGAQEAPYGVTFCMFAYGTNFYSCKGETERITSLSGNVGGQKSHPCSSPLTWIPVCLTLEWTEAPGRTPSVATSGSTLS